MPATVITFSIPERDHTLIKKIDRLAESLLCSRSVIIKRALMSFCNESFIDPVAIKYACTKNPDMLTQFKRIINEVENA